MNTLELSWSGHLNAHCSSRLLADFVRLAEHPRVRLDLSAVESMDAAAFGILTQLILTVWSHQGFFELTHPSPVVQEKLATSYLKDALESSGSLTGLESGSSRPHSG